MFFYSTAMRSNSIENQVLCLYFVATLFQLLLKEGTEINGEIILKTYIFISSPVEGLLFEYTAIYGCPININQIKF